MSLVIQKWFDEDLDPPVTTAALDDGAGWPQGGFVTVPVALALAATISLGINSYNDEFVPVVDDQQDWQAPTVVKAAPVITLFAADDDIVPQPIVATHDAASGSYSQRLIHSPVLKLWEFTDEWVPPPATMAEDTEWQKPVVYLPPAVVTIFPDGDAVPLAAAQVGSFADISATNQRAYIAPSLKQWEFTEELPIAVVPGTYADDAWQVYTTPLAKPFLTLWAGDEEAVPQQTPVGFEHGTAWSRRAVQATTLKLWDATDDIVPQPVVAVPDEDYWHQLVTYKTEITVINMPALTTGGVVTPEPLAHETYDWRGPQPQPKPVVRIWFGDEEIVTPPVPIAEEDYWWQPPQPLLSPVLRLWTGDEEAVTATTPIVDYDAGYQPSQPQLAATIIIDWPAKGTAGPGPVPFIEDEYWSYFKPLVVLPRITLWQVEDEWQIASAPLTVNEESDWKVYVPPLMQAYEYPHLGPLLLYLPDPEEIPAGSLFVPVVTHRPRGRRPYHLLIRKHRRRGDG